MVNARRLVLVICVAVVAGAGGDDSIGGAIDVVARCRAYALSA